MMTDIEAARLDFETNFLPIKGVIGVCAKSDWDGCPDCSSYDDPHETFYLSIYVDNVKVIDILPEEFQGYICTYTIVPDGIETGCD